VASRCGLRRRQRPHRYDNAYLRRVFGRRGRSWRSASRGPKRRRVARHVGVDRRRPSGSPADTAPSSAADQALNSQRSVAFATESDRRHGIR
jgi:hypothetical protein